MAASTLYSTWWAAVREGEIVLVVESVELTAPLDAQHDRLVDIAEAAIEVRTGR